MKPNNVLQYVNIKSNYPPIILKNIPEGINKRLSEISSSQEAFKQASPVNQKALSASGYVYKLIYVRRTPPKTGKRQRKRNVIWLNPPYNENVKTNVGREFLKFISKCFPKSNKLHRIFNKNTIKLSYSCMPNVRTIIEGNNKRKLAKGSKGSVQKECNCPGNTTCSLQGKCLSKDIVYQATVKTREKNLGLTATDFKAKYANHKASFKARATHLN